VREKERICVCVRVRMTERPAASQIGLRQLRDVPQNNVTDVVKRHSLCIQRVSNVYSTCIQRVSIVYVHTCTKIVSVGLCDCVYVCICRCLCARVREYARVYTRTCMCVCSCSRVCVCVSARTCV